MQSLAKLSTFCLLICNAVSKPISVTQSSNTTNPLVIVPAKRGLPYHNPPTYIKNFNAPGSHVSWAYSWASAMDPAFPTYLEYVPMLWSDSSVLTSVWSKNVKAAIKRGTKNVLGFNEPDACGPGQACMTPAAAAKAWKRYMEPFAGKVKLGGPAVTEVGTQWLFDFLVACMKCHIDFIPMHIYNNANNVGYYQRHILDIASKTGRPIWLTEFSAQGDQTTFLKTMIPWLDNQKVVERYSWFMCSPIYTGESLCQADGKPSPLGSLYELL